MFKLPKGPWIKLFDGTLEGQTVEIHSNNSSMVLVLIFEKEADKILGVVLELFKVFYCEGEIESFAETLTKNALALIKHDGKKNHKFFVLNSNPSYAKFKEEEVKDEMEELLKQIEASSKMVKEVSKAYDLKLTEISEESEDKKQAFFAEPLSLQLLSRSTAETQRPIIEESGIPGELLLGITKDGAIVKEPLEFFKKTIVDGVPDKQRMHILHLMIEGTLLSSLAAIVIDWKNSFRGLSEPTKDLQSLRKFKVDFEPIGFPVAHFTIPEQVKVDIQEIDMQGLLELFGLGKNVSAQLIVKKAKEKKYSNSKELIEEIKKTQQDEEITIYQVNRAVRAMALFESHYPGLLGGENNFDEIAKSWGKGLGRAGIIHFENTDEKTSLLLMQSLVHGLLEYYKKIGKTNRLRTMLIIPEAKQIVSTTAKSAISQAIAAEINQLSDYGIGYVLSTEKDVELNNIIVQNYESEISIIDKNDVGIKIKNRKNYRALLRTGLSACTEN